MADSFQQITSHLWVQQSRFYSTNSGVFIDQGQAALIDPGLTPAEIEEIGRFLSGKKARAELIILTHAHWDHILGTASFPGAKILAHRNFLNEIAGEAGDRLRQKVEKSCQELQFPKSNRFILPAPDITFSDAMTITVGREQLRLIYTPGHNPSGLAVFHAESGMLWAGDMLSDIEIPLFNQSLTAYEKTLELFSTLDCRVVIPGHGHATANRNEICLRIQRDQAYIVDLRVRVKGTIESRKPLERAIENCSNMIYHHRDENVSGHLTNIEQAYQELSRVG
jgi:hydroxyacylglutathione hydrolase